MAKAKVNFSGLKKRIKSFVDGYKSEKLFIANQLIREMKSTIERGQSPIRDVGRFIPYKDVTKYPRLGSKALKRRSPVNLKLTGEMLDAIEARVQSNQIKVGIFDTEQADKMRTIEDGFNRKVKLAGPRPVFPRKRGQEFTVKIVRDIFNAFRELFKKTAR